MTEGMRSTPPSPWPWPSSSWCWPSSSNPVRDPLVIMVSVPLAISGALIALAWGMATMNIYSQVGLITLVGLITKHGIPDLRGGEGGAAAAWHEPDAGRDAGCQGPSAPHPDDHGGDDRRPDPLLYASGAGAAQRFSIGIVIVAGLAIGTLFTLFVLPVIYTFLASEHKTAAGIRRVHPGQKPRAVIDPSPHQQGPERGLVLSIG